MQGKEAKDCQVLMNTELSYRNNHNHNSNKAKQSGKIMANHPNNFV